MRRKPTMEAVRGFSHLLTASHWSPRPPHASSLTARCTNSSASWSARESHCSRHSGHRFWRCTRAMAHAAWKAWPQGDLASLGGFGLMGKADNGCGPAWPHCNQTIPVLSAVANLPASPFDPVPHICAGRAPMLWKQPANNRCPTRSRGPPTGCPNCSNNGGAPTKYQHKVI